MNEAIKAALRCYISEMIHHHNVLSQAISKGENTPADLTDYEDNLSEIRGAISILSIIGDEALHKIGLHKPIVDYKDVTDYYSEITVTIGDEKFG